MSNSSLGRPKAIPDDDAAEDRGAPSFDWEFANDDHAVQRPIGSPQLRQDADANRFRREIDGRELDGRKVDGKAVESGSEKAVRPTRRVEESSTSFSAGARGQSGNVRRPSATVLPSGGRFGPARANYIRDQLDRALDRWWAVGELPPLLLLRDGLLLLEAGGSASESQRTLLLRAALAYQKGIQTAIRHQVDAERLALVLAEALVEWEVPLEPERLPTILAGDAQTQALLVGELERSRILLTGELRRRAQVALEFLPRSAKVQSTVVPPIRPVVAVVRRRRPFRQILLILLLLALVGFVYWQQRERMPAGMVAMPGATYSLIQADGRAGEVVRLEPFFIDRFEVTNRDYRTCVEKNGCLWPLLPKSATRADYFTNPAFDAYPVVNVTQTMARSYCAWQDKRLPTAAEWQAAASVSPTTGQAFRYPWGESFVSQRTNGAASRIGDTVVVGSFRPSGDSPGGVSDMAGNVAEWTDTVVTSADGKSLAFVKGGSFAGDASALTVGAVVQIEAKTALPEVGFRCVRTHLLTES